MEQSSVDNFRTNLPQTTGALTSGVLMLRAAAAYGFKTFQRKERKGPQRNLRQERRYRVKRATAPNAASRQRRSFRLLVYKSLRAWRPLRLCV
jgi:hypothetical protein